MLLQKYYAGEVKILKLYFNNYSLLDILYESKEKSQVNLKKKIYIIGVVLSY